MMTEMGISIFDWMWISFIVIATAGSIAYGAVAGRKSVNKQISRLLERSENQRLKKRYWKAIAKGKEPPAMMPKKD
jgi:hypothetical protein